MSKPIYRFLANRKWREYRRKVLMQRITQMTVVPDIIPAIDPITDVRLFFNSRDIPPGLIVDSKTGENAPRLTIQPFVKEWSQSPSSTRTSPTSRKTATTTAANSSLPTSASHQPLSSPTFPSSPLRPRPSSPGLRPSPKKESHTNVSRHSSSNRKTISKSIPRQQSHESNVMAST